MNIVFARARPLHAILPQPIKAWVVGDPSHPSQPRATQSHPETALRQFRICDTRRQFRNHLTITTTTKRCFRENSSSLSINSFAVHFNLFLQQFARAPTNPTRSPPHHPRFAALRRRVTPRLLRTVHLAEPFSPPVGLRWHAGGKTPTHS